MRVTISKEYLSTVKTLICFSISNHKMDKICLPLDISRALTFLGSLLRHFIRFLLCFPYLKLQLCSFCNILLPFLALFFLLRT